MRTLKEIRQFVADHLAEHKAQQEALSTKAAELEAAIEADRQAQHTAAANNDSEGYARAVTDESFHNAQLEQTSTAQAAPAFTPNELKALGEELKAARSAALAPLYAQMVALREQSKALYAQEQEVFNDGYAIWYSLVGMKGGGYILHPSIHPAVKELFAANRHDATLRNLADIHAGKD